MPLALLRNQARVWEKEKEALDERKKLAQLQKERAEERQIQELQRLQAAQGGKKVQEKVDWLYAAPSAGAGPQAEELEQYLLGKKTVDKLFKEQDERKMAEMAASSGQAGGSAEQGGVAGLTALGQNANNARDLAAKVREDPLLAIKQQEQAAYEAAKRKYIREGKMKGDAKVGSGTNAVPVDPSHKRKREKEAEKEEKRRRKEERHRRRESRRDRREYDRDLSDSEDEYRKRSNRDSRNDKWPSPRRHASGRDHSRRQYAEASLSPRQRSRSPVLVVKEDSQRSNRRENEVDGKRYGGRRHDSSTNAPDRIAGPDYRHERSGWPNPDHHARIPRNAEASRHNNTVSSGMSEEQRAKAREAAAARLAAMQKDAADLDLTRRDRVARNEAADAEVLAREVEQRQLSAKGLKGSGPEFMLNEYRKLGDTSLGDAIKGKGKATMLRDKDD